MIETTNISGPLTIIAICTGLGLTVILWVILGQPWPRKKHAPPKPWQQPKVFDTFAKADLEMFLDEHETKIS